jgi:rhodanese-related sulfurtransferase
MIPYAEPFVYTPQGETIELQTASWNGENNIILTEDSVSGETKLWQVLIGNQRTELYTESFYSVPDGYPRDFENGYFKINSLAVYKDRLYAGCDGGFVIMLTSCVKCYQLKKPVDYDINEITIDGDYMVINNTERISMAELGADSTEADEARLMLQNGAVLIDVRTAEEYSEKAYEDSVNIPVDEIEEGIAAYEKDRVIIFCCASGVRAAAAVEKAKEMGYTNVYNLGSVDKLL